MKQRIAAGAFIVDDERILLVNHRREGRYDFWVPPGGGVVGTESLEAAAAREVREETGLDVEIERLLYIEEFWQPTQREVKFWFTGRPSGGRLSTAAEEAVREHIVGAAFLGRDACADRTLFPDVLRSDFWRDRRDATVAPRYLGLREMAFY